MRADLLSKQEIRNPQTGQLIDRGRSVHLNKIHALRDSLWCIKRYLYRRITSGVFPPLPQEVDVSNDTLRRLTVWLQPQSGLRKTKTEVYCLNSRLNKNIQGIGTPAVFVPTSKEAGTEFYRSSFERLKNWAYTRKCIPVALLGLLSGKSFIKHADRRNCLNISKEVLRISKSSTAGPFGTCGTHGTVAIFKSQTGFVTHYGNGVGLWPLLTNRFLPINGSQAI